MPVSVGDDAAVSLPHVAQLDVLKCVRTVCGCHLAPRFGRWPSSASTVAISRRLAPSFLSSTIRDRVSASLSSTTS